MVLKERILVKVGCSIDLPVFDLYGYTGIVSFLKMRYQMVNLCFTSLNLDHGYGCD